MNKNKLLSKIYQIINKNSAFQGERYLVEDLQELLKEYYEEKENETNND